MTVPLGVKKRGLSSRGAPPQGRHAKHDAKPVTKQEEDPALAFDNMEVESAASSACPTPAGKPHGEPCSSPSTQARTLPIGHLGGRGDADDSLVLGMFATSEATSDATASPLTRRGDVSRPNMFHDLNCAEETAPLGHIEELTEWGRRGLSKSEWEYYVALYRKCTTAKEMGEGRVLTAAELEGVLSDLFSGGQEPQDFVHCGPLGGYLERLASQARQKAARVETESTQGELTDFGSPNASPCRSRAGSETSMASPASFSCTTLEERLITFRSFRSMSMAMSGTGRLAGSIRSMSASPTGASPPATPLQGRSKAEWASGNESTDDSTQASGPAASPRWSPSGLERVTLDRWVELCKESLHDAHELYGISQAEFESMMRMFCQHNTTGDGALRWTEFAELAQEMAFASSKNDALVYLQSLDTNHSGSIDVHEFLVGAQLIQAGRAVTKAQKMHGGKRQSHRTINQLVKGFISASVPVNVPRRKGKGMRVRGHTLLKKFTRPMPPPRVPAA